MTETSPPYGDPPRTPTSRVTEETLLDWETSYDTAKLAAAAEIRRLRAMILGYISGDEGTLEQLRAEVDAIRKERPAAAHR